MDEHEHYRPDIVWTGDTITSTRMRVRIRRSADRDKRTKHMQEARDACTMKTLNSFPYSSSYGWLDRYAAIKETIFTSLSYTFISVFVVMNLFQSLSGAILVTCMVGLVCVNIMGMMTLWDLQLNVVTAVNLVMAVGFAVDYSAHISEAFVHSRGSRDKRMQHSLNTMGRSVLKGGISTLLGIAMLAFSQSAGFVMMFKM